MSKITREQIINWNKGLQNGFELDVRHYLYWNEKQIHKYIVLDTDENGDQNILEIALLYRDHSEEKTNQYNVTYRQRTGKVVPTLHFYKWLKKHGEDILVGNGLGVWISIGDPMDKKMYSQLIKLSGQYTDKQFLQMAGETNTQLDNGVILG